MTNGKGQEGWPHPTHDDHLDQRLDEVMVLLRSIMSSLTNLQTADANLKAEVVTFLQDVVTALAVPDADLDAITSDLNAQVTALQSNDPTVTPPVFPSA